MTVFLPRLWNDQSRTRLLFWSIDEFSCLTQLPHPRVCRRTKAAERRPSLLWFSACSRCPLNPAHAHQIWMLKLLWCSRKTKTINGTGSAGDDHRPTLGCRRWRKPLLELASLITSQLSGVVWHPPAFQRVWLKKKKTHSRTVNRSRGGNGNSDCCLLTGTERLILWESLDSERSAGLSVQLPFIPNQGRGGGAFPAVRGEVCTGLSHTVQSLKASMFLACGRKLMKPVKNPQRENINDA